MVSSPPVPPRRKSQDKLKTENKENVEKNRRSSSEAVIKVGLYISHERSLCFFENRDGYLQLDFFQVLYRATRILQTHMYTRTR